MRARLAFAALFAMPAMIFLAGLLPLARASAQNVPSESPVVCRDVARLANEQTLERELVRSGGSLTAADESDRGELIGRVDFDGDGRADSAYLTEGEDLVFFDDDERLEVTPDPSVDWNSDDFRWSTVLGTLSHKGTSYIVWMRGDALRYLSRLTPERVHKVVCQFAQREQPERTLLAGHQRVCKAAVAGQLAYVQFDNLHAVPSNQRSALQPRPGAARVDIDNDGKDDYVIRARYATAAGLGCQVDGLAILNDARTGLDERAVAMLVQGAADECGDTLAAFTFDGQSYLERQGPGSHRKDAILEIEDAREQQVCEISVVYPSFVLTEYERLLSAAKAHNAEPWEYAFGTPGLDAADLLLKNGHSVNESVHQHQTLLEWAVWQQRQDLFDWLLAHGADPNFRGDEKIARALDSAVRYGYFDMATRLVEAGASLAPIMSQLTDVVARNADASRPFLRAVIAHVGYVPEMLLRQSARLPSPVLDDLIESGLPVQIEVVQWHGGKMQGVPWWVAGELSADPAKLGKVTRMFERVLPPTTQLAEVTFGTFYHGWEVMRYMRSAVPDDQLLIFATSVCLYFFDVDCGPPDLVSRARAWAETLNLACDDPRVAGKLDPVACSVAMYYATLANVAWDIAVLIVPVTPESRSVGSPILSRGDLRDLYLAKRARE